MVTKEEKFYSRLKDVFLGEKIEGESGYINLMKVKSRYYERGILPKLKEYIDEIGYHSVKVYFCLLVSNRTSLELSRSHALYASLHFFSIF